MSDDIQAFVDRVAEVAAKDPALSRLVDDAKWYAGLLEDPAFQRLAKKVLEENDRWMEGVARRQFKGELVSQREIDTQRGFVLGALFVIRHPAKAEKGLESAARIAWRMAQAEAEREQEEESPYA